MTLLSYVIAPKFEAETAKSSLEAKEKEVVDKEKAKADKARAKAAAKVTIHMENNSHKREYCEGQSGHARRQAEHHHGLRLRARWQRPSCQQWRSTSDACTQTTRHGITCCGAMPRC